MTFQLVHLVKNLKFSINRKKLNQNNEKLRTHINLES